VRWGRRGSILGLALAMAVAVASGATALERWLLPPGGDDVLALLLLGSDDGPPRDKPFDEGNADGFQLLFVSGDRQHATFVSIPRDSYVVPPGRSSRDKINHCLNTGPERCVETVAAAFGVEVDGYLLTNMRAFTRGVERFGGIEIDVEQHLRVGGTSIAPGRQTLDGPESLVYARDRKNRTNGDVARAQAQARLLEAAHRQVHADRSPGTVFRALTELRRHTVTDIPGPQLARLAFEAFHLPPDNVQRAVLPGSVGMDGPAWVFFLADGAQAIIDDAAADARLG
jgi:polyisoprenyl-teichoic acid--peptidoglycan teichoic acid transferase